MLLTRRMLVKSLAMSGLAMPFMSNLSFAQANRNIIRVGTSLFPFPFTPGLPTLGGYATNFGWGLMHVQLIRYDTNGVLQPELAESWEMDESGAWVFRLRDVKFSDGTPLTSADVKWSIERMATDEVGFSERGDLKSITAIETPDNHTVRVVTASPTTAIPHILGHLNFFILGKDSVTESNPQGLGAGPFVLKAYERDVFADFEPNPHYFRPGLPRVAGIRVTLYADENLRVAALLSGDVDIIDFVPWSAMDTIESTPGVVLEAENEGAFLQLLFSGKGPFSDARLRRAVAFGIKRDEILQTSFFGRGAPMLGTPRSRGSDFYNAEHDNYHSYDPDQVRSLLQQAGVPDGFECTMLSTSQYSMHRDSSLIIQANLAEFGIKVNLTMPDWVTRQDLARKGEHDMAINGGATASLDPSALTNQFLNPELPLATSRGHSFAVPGLAALIEQCRLERDLAKQQAIVNQIDQLVLDNTAFCGLVYRATGFARREEVQGFKLRTGLLSTLSYTLNEEWAFAS